MDADVDSAQRLVQLRFRPLWLYVDAVREFCAFFSHQTFDDAELGGRVGLVVHELVENAIRYGDDDELELSIEREHGGVVVSVANAASEEDVAQLEATVAALLRVPPEDAYACAIERAATRCASESGLGLTRIRCEARFELGIRTTPGRVCITARGEA